MFTFLAQQSLGRIGEGQGLGPFSGIALSQSEAARKFGGAISAIVGLLTVVAGIYFIFQFVIGGVQWISSGGDKAGIASAQGKITQALIGFVLIAASIAIVKILGQFLGFDILNPAAFIESIGFK
jgi:hypothetical protein